MEPHSYSFINKMLQTECRHSVENWLLQVMNYFHCWDPCLDYYLRL